MHPQLPHGPFVDSFPAIWGLTAFLAALHLFLFIRHNDKKSPQSYSFLWLGFLCALMSLRAYASFHRYQSADIPELEYWLHRIWSINPLLILFSTLYYYALRNRWPSQLGRLIVASCTIIWILHLALPGNIGLQIQSAPHIYTTPWGEQFYTVPSQARPAYLLLALLAFISAFLGTFTGIILTRSTPTRTQGFVLIPTTLVIILSLVYSILVDQEIAPPLIVLDHAMVPLLLAMSIAITDSAFRSNNAMQSAEETRNRLYHLMQTVPGVPYQLWVPASDSPAEFRYISPRIEELFGIPVEPTATLFPRFSQCLGPDEQEKWENSLAQVRKSPTPWLYTGRLNRPDGRITWFRAQSNPMAIADGVLHSGILIDVTKEKAAELDKNNLLNELNLRNRELESIMYSATHDLRTPLVNLECFSKEALLSLQSVENGTAYNSNGHLPQEWLEIELKDPLVRLNDNALRIGRRLNALLTLTRAGRSLLLIHRSEPLPVIQSVLKQMQETLVKHQVTVDLPSEIAPCLFDRSQLFDALHRILENSIAFRHPERPLHIQITSQIHKETCALRIADNGQGFDPRYNEIIFEGFHQLEPGKNGCKGEGIGLTMARTALTRMHGTLKAEGRPGMGATFTLELPLS